MSVDQKESTPKKELPYYLASEVALHNTPEDIWVSKFGRVLDLTQLCKENSGGLVLPILKFAGQDISHWFDPLTQQPKMYMDPTLNVRVPYTPYGRYLHIPPPDPVSDWSTDFGTPWWEEERYVVGHLSKKVRKIRIVNNLTAQDDTLEVCAEETLEAVRARYMRYNKHAHGYTWKRLGRPLDMSKTLQENGIIDEDAEFADLGIPEDEYIPAIHLSFNDDLTVA